MKQNKTLSQIATVKVDNDACVVLEIGREAKMDLIALGCFLGNETLIRVTKNPYHTFTIWRADGTNVSWEHGKGGGTLVTDSLNSARILIVKACRILGVPLDAYAD